MTSNLFFVFLVILTIAITLYSISTVWANAWRARGVEREKTRQIEIKSRVREAEANAKIVNAPLPAPSTVVRRMEK